MKDSGVGLAHAARPEHHHPVPIPLHRDGNRVMVLFLCPAFDVNLKGMRSVCEFLCFSDILRCLRFGLVLQDN